MFDLLVLEDVRMYFVACGQFGDALSIVEAGVNLYSGAQVWYLRVYGVSAPLQDTG